MTRATVLAFAILAATPLPAEQGQLAADLAAVPRPNLATVEDGVRRQLEEERAALDALLDDGEKSDEELAEAFAALGELYHAYDLTEPAAACYRNAHRLAPGIFRPVYLLGVLQRMDGELEAARESLETALGLRPGDLPALLHLAYVELADDRPERAESLAREALEKDPECAAAHDVLGKGAQARRDFQAAVEHFDRVLALQPTASRVHYQLARLHRRLGDAEAAELHLETIGGADVGFPDPLLAGLREAPAGAAAYMQHGARAREAGRYDEAVDAYMKAVELAPRDAAARRDLGLVLSEAGRLDAAIAQYREAARLEPDKALTRFSLGLLLKDSGDMEAARRELEKAVELEPEHRDFRFVLATLLAEGGSFAAAAEHFQRILEDSPRDSEVRLRLAMARAGLGEPEAAAADAEAVLSMDAPPWTKARAHHLLAAARLAGGQPEGAFDHLRRAIELQPEFSEAHFMLANLLGQAGRFGEAAEHYRRVLAVEPERIPARLGEATALALAGREAEAVERLEEGLRALPGETVLAHTLSKLLLSAEDPAARDGERALALASELFRAEKSFEHAETLAMALAAVGRFAEAAELQRALISQVPDGTDPRLLDRLRRRLELYEQEKAGSDRR